MAITTLPPPPRSTANPAPVRTANSVRRTSSIDVSWPGGDNGERLFIGRVRDYRTPADGGSGSVIEEAEYRAILAKDKTITSIVAEPETPGIERLVGVRGGNHLRLFIKETMPELIERAAPIYLALDDISGTALVSMFAWAQFQEGWQEQMRSEVGPEVWEKRMADRIDVCWGLQAGNSGITGAHNNDVGQADAGELRNPLDPEGWHLFPETTGAAFRRARRIDVSRDKADGLIHIAASFQDSAARREGGRMAIHEYDIAVTADPETLEILTLEPTARILPFSECPGAIHNVQRLIGKRIGTMRDEVLAQLRGPEGCTHLNDALRALAEVPKLASYL